MVKVFLVLVVLSLVGIGYADAKDSSSVKFSNTIAQILALDSKSVALSQLDQINANLKLTTLEKYQVLKALATTYYQLGNLKQSMVILEQLIELTNSNKMPKRHADSQKMLGIIFYFSGENVRSLQAYQTSLEYFEESDSPVVVANLHNNIGLVQASMGKMAAALRSYQLAEALYDSHGTRKDRTDIKFNIAGLYNRLHRYNIAIKMYLTVIKQRVMFHDTEGLALVYGDIGVAYQNAGDYLQAKHYIFKSLKHHQENNNQYETASQSHNLAEVYNHTGQVDDAEKFASQAIELGILSDNKSAYAGGLYSLAVVKFRQKEFKSALANLNLSNQVIKASKGRDQLHDNLMLMSLIYAALNQTEQSLAVHLKFTQGLHEQNNQAFAMQLAQYQVELESEQLKQQVNELNQKRILSQLKSDKADQNRNIQVFIGVLLLFSGIVYYRRSLEIKRKNQLAILVKQRTNELELLMLELKQANEIKSQFLANMSHEIRTPLTAVIGQAEAIIAGDMPSNLLINEVDIILKNSNHLLTLVNDILDLSRIEANKLELDLHHHDLHLELDAISDLFVEQARVKGLSFNIIEKLPRPFVVKIDRVRLKQILINLCSNAIKFTYNGSIDVTVSLEDCQLIFKVTDTGIGLSEQQLPFVFDSFSQADSSINRRFGGSGLGLCLSQQLATLMGGQIDVVSEVNQGSTFTLTISCPDCQCSEELMTVASPSIIEKYHGPNLTGLVLLADDHQDNRRMIARLLTTVGLEVISAKNGCEVIELAQCQQPDLILLDIQMPEMDGIEAFNILRAQGFDRPIIALTANAMHHEIEQYLKIGFDDYLSKPIERTLFIDTVAFFLKQTTELQLEQVDMSDLAADFVVGLVDEIIELERYLAAGNYVSVALLIHRIGGAAAMFGFADIAKLAATIELKIKIKQQQQANILLEDFFAMAKQLLNNHSIGPN